VCSWDMKDTDARQSPLKLSPPQKRRKRLQRQAVRESASSIEGLLKAAPFLKSKQSQEIAEGSPEVFEPIIKPLARRLERIEALVGDLHEWTKRLEDSRSLLSCLHSGTPVSQSQRNSNDCSLFAFNLGAAEFTPASQEVHSQTEPKSICGTSSYLTRRHLQDTMAAEVLVTPSTPTFSGGTNLPTSAELLSARAFTLVQNAMVDLGKAVGGSKGSIQETEVAKEKEKDVSAERQEHQQLLRQRQAPQQQVQHVFSPGDFVELVNSSHADLNGEKGSVIDALSTGRLRVKMGWQKMGRVVSVKMENVRMIVAWACLQEVKRLRDNGHSVRSLVSAGYPIAAIQMDDSQSLCAECCRPRSMCCCTLDSDIAKLWRTSS